jgi:hypothetical protein
MSRLRQNQLLALLMALIAATSHTLPSWAEWEGGTRYKCRFNKGPWIGASFSYNKQSSTKLDWDDGLTMTYTDLPGRSSANNLRRDKLGGYWHFSDYRNDRDGKNWFDLTNVNNKNLIECRRPVTP